MLKLLRKIAFPFSLAYALVVFVRNCFYDWELFTSKTYQTPTICIGNLSVGGPGKTPMVEYLIRLLEGQQIAVLSRGYKRKSKGFVLADAKSTVEDLGDEPYQLYRKFPHINLVVDADRRNGIAKLEANQKPDVILLDDAFQHRKVKPSFSILLTAHGNLFVNDWYLPTGNLRDFKGEAKRADIIVVTKCPAQLSVEGKNAISKKIRPKSHQKVLFASLSYHHTIGDGEKTMPLDGLKGKKFALVTGIASPGPLVKYLKGLGLTFQHFQFGDHHYFSENEIQSFSNFEYVLTTEKDFVRLDGRVDKLYYLGVAHAFEPNDAAVLREAVLKQL